MKVLLKMFGIVLFVGALYFNLHQLNTQDQQSDLTMIELAATAVMAQGACEGGPPQGCWPNCPFYSRSVHCGGLIYVIRCDCGTGYCVPEDQEFC